MMECGDVIQGGVLILIVALCFENLNLIYIVSSAKFIFCH